MGILSELGQVLEPKEAAALQPYLRQLGIRQFLKVFQKYQYWRKTSKDSIIKWGEEIEGHFLEMNESQELELCTKPFGPQYEDLSFPLMQEYGQWMYEMIPSEPYSTESDFSEIIETIKHKYASLQRKSRICLTIPGIPFLGVRDLQKEKKFDNNETQSIYIDDDKISTHIRFRLLDKNIRLRRGNKVEMNVPLFMDKNTSLEEIALSEPNPSFIHLDSTVFGLGMSCLQCTFSTQSLDHARYVFDQMHVISPLFLALTAGTPFHKGKISDWDARWKTIGGLADCRTSEERNPESQHYLPTSRYCQTQLYLWSGSFNKPSYNDSKLNFKEQTVSYIKDAARELNIEIDDFLVTHLANIFKRDALIVHENFKKMTDDENLIFEMLNGTNWNSVRLKIPINDTIGWRVQFRTMEIQLMAQENAAFSLFIHLFTRALHQDKNLNLYIPISKVSENFERAHRRDAVRKEKFWFRVNIFDEGEPILKQLTLHEIMFGNQDFGGIFSFVKKSLLKEQGCNEDMVKKVNEIEKFLREKTSGQRITLAQWMREFVDKHPKYTHNSILPKKVMDDMLLKLSSISRGDCLDNNFKPIFA